MGEMDPYSSPYRIPNNGLHIPFPHSLLAPDRNPKHQWQAAPVLGAREPIEVERGLQVWESGGRFPVM